VRTIIVLMALGSITILSACTTLKVKADRSDRVDWQIANHASRLGG